MAQVTAFLPRAKCVMAFAGMALGLAAAIVIAPATATADDSLEAVQSKGTLDVCGVDGLLPYSSSDAEIPGFEVEIARAMGEKMGVEVNHVWVSWDALIPALTSARCDAIINGMFITEARLEVIDFSEPYYASGETILVREDNDTVTGIEDLADKKVGALAGSVTVDVLERKGVGDLVVYPDQNTIFLELNNQRIEAAYLEAPSAAWILRSDPSLSIRIVDSYVPDERFNAGVGLRKGDDALREAFNEIIAELREDGTIKAILESYRGPFFPIAD